MNLQWRKLVSSLVFLQRRSAAQDQRQRWQMEDVSQGWNWGARFRVVDRAVLNLVISEPREQGDVTAARMWG